MRGRPHLGSLCSFKKFEPIIAGEIWPAPGLRSGRSSNDRGLPTARRTIAFIQPVHFLRAADKEYLSKIKKTCSKGATNSNLKISP